MRIATWNVNSVRARLDHVLTWLSDNEPEVLCVQETKVEDALFPRVPFAELGYTVTMHGGRALAGVATLSKGVPTATQAGFRVGPPDRHPRVLAVKYAGVWIYNLYAPNGTELGSDAFTYKLEWYRRLRVELDEHHRTSEDLVLVGDFNVAPQARDVWNPEAFAGRLLFTEDEHAALAHLQEFGLEDCFRRHEQAGGYYSWFDYRNNGFARGEGLRIDLVLATAGLAQRCVKVVHDLGPRGWDSPSDHVPVVAEFGPTGG